MSTTAADCMRPGPVIGGGGAAAMGSGRDQSPLIAPALAAAAAEDPLPSLMEPATSTDIPQSHLTVEWASPAPGWLLAVSSAAFFLLAFFAFSQYRKRITRTLSSSGVDDSGVGSGSSGPAVTSLPNASGDRVPDLLFSRLSFRTSETCLNAASPALARGSAEPPASSSSSSSRCVDGGGGDGAHRAYQNTLNGFSAVHPLTTSNTSVNTAAAAAGGGWLPASSEIIAAAPLSQLSVARAAAGRSTAGVSVTATAAAPAAAGAVPGGILAASQEHLRDAPPGAAGAAACSHPSLTTDATTTHPNADIEAAGSTAIAASDDNAEPAAAVAASMSTISSSSSPYSKPAPPTSVMTAAVSGTVAGRLHQSSGACVDCHSIRGPRLLRRDADLILRTRKAAGNDEQAIAASATAASAAAASDSLSNQDSLDARAHISGVTSSTSFFDRTDAAAVCGRDAAVAHQYDGSFQCVTYPAYPPIIYFTSCAAGAEEEDAGAPCCTHATPLYGVFSLDHPGDVPALSSCHMLLQQLQEVMLHGAGPPSKGRRGRLSGRSFIGHSRHPTKSRDEELNSSSAAPAEQRMLRKAGTTRAETAEAKDGGRERETAESGDASHVIEGAEYTSLAADEEEADGVSAAAPCAAVRTTFTFDGASMRSVILAIVTAAALLRALLLLLQLVANPLETKRPVAPVVFNRVPLLRPSLLFTSSVMWHGPTTTTTIEEQDAVKQYNDTGAGRIVIVHHLSPDDAPSTNPNLYTVPFESHSRTAGSTSKFSLVPAAEPEQMLPSSTAAAATASPPGKSSAVASTLSDMNHDLTLFFSTTTSTFHLQEEPPCFSSSPSFSPSFSPSILTAGSLLRPRHSPSSSSATEATVAATSSQQHPVNNTAAAPVTTLLLPPVELPSIVSPKSLVQAHSPLALPLLSHDSSPLLTTRRSKGEPEIPAAAPAVAPAPAVAAACVVAASAAASATAVDTLSTGATDSRSYPQVVLPDLSMLHFLAVTARSAAGQEASAETFPALPKQHTGTKKKQQKQQQQHKQQQKKAYNGSVNAGQEDVGAYESSLLPNSSISRSLRDARRGPPLMRSSSTGNSSSSFPSFSSRMNPRKHNTVKHIKDGSTVGPEYRNKQPETSASSSRSHDGSIRWIAAVKKNKKRSQDIISQSTKTPARERNVNTCRRSKRRSNPGKKTPVKINSRRRGDVRGVRSSRTSSSTSSSTATTTKGGRTGWPSALWLRTLARSLPPMLCIEAYALLILFLLDLYYASSRLEHVRWIAVGSYVALGGVWVLFVSIAGLTVAEDNTPREAAHLFARSVCWLLGFCFTLLSVSLAVVGSLVLKQLKGRKSTQLFFRSPLVMVDQPIREDGSDSCSLLHAVVSSNVYRPSRPCRQYVHPFLQGDDATLTHYHPPAAANITNITVGRNKSWMPACCARYWSANPAATSAAAPAAGAMPEEKEPCSHRIYNDDTPAMLLPSQQHDIENQERRNTQHTSCHMSDLAWIDQRKQKKQDKQKNRRQEVGDRVVIQSLRLQREEETMNHREEEERRRSNFFMLPVNWVFLSYFRKKEEIHSGEISSASSYSTAWQRLLMLTLSCPPLLMIRGVHLLLVGAQVFPHYYPSFVEEKGTFDVLIYLITEWLPLTLLVCASSHTATPKQRRSNSSVNAQASTLHGDAHGDNTSFRPIRQSQCLHRPSQSPFNRSYYGRRGSSYHTTSPWRHRVKRNSGNDGGGDAASRCIYEQASLLSPPLYDASVCATQVQPHHEKKQYTTHNQHGDAEEQHNSRELQNKRFFGMKTKHNRIWNMALRVTDHLMSKRTSDERFGVPLLTDDVLSGPQALRLAQQQHCASSSSSSNNSSRRDSDCR